jgi:putative serine protease PepD
VIGVNSQIESGSGDNSGVGFAIPSNTVQKVVKQLLAGGQVQHSFLGVQLTDAQGGAAVASVTSGSPAASAGLARGDVITAIAGGVVRGADDAVSAIQSHKPGDRLTLKVTRGGATRSVTVTLGDRSS